MIGLIQGIAGALIAVILGTVVARSGKDISVLLSLAACCAILWTAMGYLKPVVDLMGTLADLSGLDGSWIGVVFKTVGIGLLSQIAGLICADAGNSALGKVVEILACAAVLWLSIPLIQALLELIQEMTGKI